MKIVVIIQYLILNIYYVVEKLIKYIVNGETWISNILLILKLIHAGKILI